MLPEIIVDTASNLGAILAGRFAREYRRVVEAEGRFAIALPGGSVAHVLFPRLARLTLDWSRTEFFWTDERAVPEDDPESNYGLARALWLDPAGVPDTRIHRMEGDAADLDAGADAYAGELTRVLGAPPRFDLVLLGIGSDGHVASLFPGHPLLLETRRWVAAVADGPEPFSRRLTLTLPTLTAADLIVVAAFGEGKARVVRAALEERDASLPVTMVLQRTRQALVLLDPEAASLLS